MHVSKAELPALVLGAYEGRFVDAGEFRIAFESMAAVARNMGAVAR